MSRIVLIVKFLFFGYNIDYRESDFKFTFLMFMAARQFHWHEIRRRRKARAGKNSFPPTPFLFARPSVQFGARLPAEASAQAGSAPSIPFKKGSDFVKQTHQN